MATEVNVFMGSRYAGAAVLGMLVGGVTGLVGPIYEYQTNVDNPDTPDVDEGAIQYYFNGVVHDWIVWWGLAFVVALLFYGFGNIGAEWLVGIFIGAVTHLVVAYLMGFIVPILANLAP